MNRDNPFLYVMDMANDELVDEIEEMIKGLIVYGITGTIAILTSVIHMILNQYVTVFPIVFIATLFIHGIIELRYGISQTKTMEINHKRFTPESPTEFAYVNNEVLFSQTNEIFQAIGSISAIRRTFNIYTIIATIIIVCNIFKIFTYIFT